MKKTITLFALSVALFSCEKPLEDNGSNSSANKARIAVTYLKDADPEVIIGTAFNDNVLDNVAGNNLIATEYNSVTSENEMKMNALQPTENGFMFSENGKTENYNLRNMAFDNGKKRIHGHALVWHRALPNWVTAKETATAQRTVFLDIMKKHIQTVVTHFGNPTSKFKDAAGNPLLKSWDVVNEVFYDDGTYRNAKNIPSCGGDDRGSIWRRNIGSDYVIQAFTLARQAAEANGNTNLKLFYNDYGHEYSKVKTDAIYAMLMDLKSRTINGKPIIDGVGLQFHISNTTDRTQIEYAIQKMKSTGLKVHIAELDINIYPKRNASPSCGVVGTINDATTQAQRETAQKDLYYFVAQTYKRIVPANQRWGITLWNVGDKDSWLQNGGNATLYDLNYVKKETYYSFLAGVRNAII